jgi:hypothetical protein
MSSASSYATINQAAEQLHVSVTTIHRWIAAEALLVRSNPNQEPQIFTESIAALLNEKKSLPIIDPVATDVLKVAIVEDDLDLTKLLEMTIHSFDFKTQIQTAGNGLVVAGAEAAAALASGTSGADVEAAELSALGRLASGATNFDPVWEDASGVSQGNLQKSRQGSPPICI